MDDDRLQDCLELLDAADALLLSSGEVVLAAHLSAVIEPLKARAAARRAQTSDVGRR